MNDKIGLVMEGGAMRGMFTAGVTDTFMEYGIEFDGAVGVSAGATFGLNVKSKQKGRAIRYNCQFSNDYRFGSFKSWRKTGNLFDVDFCYRDIPDKLDIFDYKTFTENPMEFYVVATDLESGKAIYHKCHDCAENDLQWIRSSASIPFVSQIVEIGDRKLLDGGTADSIPLRFIQHKGYKKNVVILTQPADYVKEKNKLIPLCQIKYKDYPEYIKTFARRHIMYNKQTKYVWNQEKEGTTFVICPPAKLDVKSAENDPVKLRKVYEIGREEALKAINERGLLEFMKK